MKPVIKEYLLQKVDDLLGTISSSKGRRTKVQNFIAALPSFLTSRSRTVVRRSSAPGHYGVIPLIYAIFNNIGKIKHSVNCSPVTA